MLRIFEELFEADVAAAFTFERIDVADTLQERGPIEPFTVSSQLRFLVTFIAPALFLLRLLLAVL